MPKGLDLHDLLEAMQERFKEHEAQILAWPWRWFCQKWARLIRFGYEEHERQEAKRREQVWRQLRQG